MGNIVTIRSYRPADRAAVRRLSCDTADHGEPVERFFHDREAVANVLVRYYTDYEPQSLWIAEQEDVLAGYLTGCLDTKRCNRVMVTRVLPGTIIGAVARGALWRAKTWRLCAALLETLLLGGFPHKVDLREYPAHLHINVRQDFRGKQIGRQLIERFLAQADGAGVGGTHVVVLGHNERGRRFFETMGFHLLREQPLILPEARGFRRTCTAVYGRKKGD